MKMSNKVYDTLKVIAWVALPLSALLAEIGEILNIPTMKTVSLIIIAVNTFVGVLLKTSNDAYNAQLLEGDTDGQTN